MRGEIEAEPGLFSAAVNGWVPFVVQYRTIFIQPDREMQALISEVAVIGCAINPPQRSL
jgi:hypothetical protein